MDSRDEQIQFLLGRVRDFDARLARIENALALLQPKAAPESTPQQVSEKHALPPALAALPDFFSDLPAAPPAATALPALTSEASWEQWRGEWSRLREFSSASGPGAPPALDELWTATADPRAGAEQPRALKGALEAVRAWAKSNTPGEPELAATLHEFEAKISGEYQQQLDTIPAYRHWSAAAKSMRTALADAPVSFFRGSLKKGIEALEDWRELIERNDQAWSGELYDHKTALVLTDVFDELSQEPDECAGALQNLEAFLNLLCVCRDTRLKLGVAHGALPTELQNCFTDDKSNRPVRPVSQQKVARVKRSRWVRVDGKGAPVSELCKPSYELA